MPKATKKPWVIGKPDFEDPYVDVPKLELESKINSLIDEFEKDYAPIGVIQKIHEEVLIEYADEVEEESQLLKADIKSTVETIAVELVDALGLQPDDIGKAKAIVASKFKHFVGMTDFKYPVKLD